MERLLRDKELEAELDGSAMEPAPLLGGFASLAFRTQTPYALHLTREPEPFLWWHEFTRSLGNEAGSRTRNPIEPWDCFSRFCALHDASDEAVFNFASRYGILGIWPCQRQFCVTHLPLRSRITFYRKSGLVFVWEHMPFEKAVERAKMGLEPYQPRLTDEERYCNEMIYSEESNCIWLGEPISLWRRLAKHLRALARIGASLHRGELVPESEWAEVLLPGQININRSGFNNGGNKQHQIENQRAELADLVNRWLWNVTTKLVLLDQPIGKMGVQLDAEWIEGTWGSSTYERCEANGYAWADLRGESGWNRDGMTDLETRPSLLLNFLILQLTAIISSGAAVCPRCGNPAPACGPGGKRLPVTKTYCGDECKVEARKETKRNSWRKAKENGARATQ